MGIEIPTPESPPKRRIAWLAGAGFAIVLGLALLVGPLVKVTSWVDLAFAMFLVVPGLAWLTAGVKIILRVSGRGPTTRVMPAVVLSLMMSAGLGLAATMIFLFFWVIGRSVWLNEGGDLSDFPNNSYLLVAGGCLMLGLIAAIATVKAFQIEDPPRN